MLIAQLFRKFPVIETERLVMKAPVLSARNLIKMHLMLNESEVIDNYLDPNVRYESLINVEELITACNRLFFEKQALIWFIHKKEDDELIGIREIYFDKTPIETQGFISEKYSTQGYVEEVFHNVFRTLDIFGYTEYQTTSNGKTLAPIRIFYNLGFQTTNIYYTRFVGWKLEFNYNLNKPEGTFRIPITTIDDKDLIFFIHAFIRPHSGMLNKYRGTDEIMLQAKNIYGMTRTYMFIYDGEYIISKLNHLNLRKSGDDKKIRFDLDDRSFMDLYEFVVNECSEISNE